MRRAYAWSFNNVKVSSFVVDKAAPIARYSVPMKSPRWSIKLTLASSTKDRLEEIAREDRRSVSNYVRVLIEKDTREKDERTA